MDNKEICNLIEFSLKGMLDVVVHLALELSVFK